MGIRESKVSFLEYEEAVKRVSDEEIERLKKTFRCFTGNGSLLTKQTFTNDVLSGLVPTRLAEQLFLTCGGSQKGINFRDLLVLLVLITKGSVDEKVRFLFNLMSVDGSSITREDLENFYTACENNATLPVCIHQAFWRNDNKLSFQEFHDWISTNPGFSTITIWLLEEQAGSNGIQLSSVEDKPSFYKSLASHSKLNEKEIIELEKRYWYLKSTSSTGKFDLKLFKNCTTPPLPERFTKSFYDFFDKNDDNHIDFKEMVCGVSTFCRGLTSERLEACFDMFDTDHDGILNDDEMKSMVDGLLEVYKQYGDNLEMQADDVIQELTKQPNGGAIGLSLFRSWASTSILIHEFLLLLSQICHIIFGLKPVLREEEGCIIRRWLDRQKKDGMNQGSFYYLVPSKWWNSWKDYVNFEKCGVSSQLGSDKAFAEHADNNSKTNDLKAPVVKEEALTPTKSFKLRNNQVQTVSNGHALKPPPSSIENGTLLQAEPAEYKKLYNLTGEGGRLKQNILLIDGKDYETLPEQVWRSMQMWYGSDLELPRVVLKASKSGQPELELYPVPVLIYKHSPPPKNTGFSLNSIGINNFLSQIFGGMSAAAAPSTNNHEPQPLVTPKKVLTYKASFSKENTIKQIVEFVGRKLKIHPDDLRLWIMKGENENILLEEDEKTVEDVPLNEGCHLLLEIRNRDLSWPEEMNSLVATRNFRERSNTGLLVKGATGLHNLGNTCFMNSAIQCLSNTKPLTEYFCSKLFAYELNRTNPLGMKGLLARRYGDLVTDLWKGIYRSIAPVKLRWTIGRYAPRFNGFQQHDSQELMSFLLDGLHEDTNRVHDKPYVELKDSDGRPDSELANEAWENHLKRNQSIIVDLFQGMLKSQVRCLHCGHTSIRFDPFTFLSLPLPMERSLYLEIPVFTRDGSGIIKYGLLLPPDSTVLHVRKELSKLCTIPVENLLLAEVVGFTIRNFLMDSQKLSTTAMGFLYAYEYIPYDENYTSPSSPMHHHSSCDTLSSTTSSNQQQQQPQNVISTNIGNTTPDPFDENTTTTNTVNTLKPNEQSSTLKNNTRNNTTTKTSKSKKPKNPFRHRKTYSHSKVLEVSSQKPSTKESTSSTEVLEVPGIVNASFSTVQGTGNSSVRSSASSECVWDSSFHGVVVAINRKTIQQTNYFLSWQKFRPVVFGVPCVLSIAEDTKNKDVYEQISKHISRYITGEQHLQDEDNVYPFELKCVDKDGNYCVTCPWYRFCHGCKVPCDDEYFAFNSTYLAIDWDSTTLHLQYQQALEKNYTMDSSIDTCYKLLQEPISVEQCLRDFTKEEELGDDETWYCSKCKEHRKIAKKFDIWKLPAILVIHLKRFQLVNNRWVKSNKLVRFPFQNFNISPYVPHSSASTTSNITEVKSCEDENEEQNALNTLLQHEQKEELPEIEGKINNNNYKYNLYAISCHAGMLNGGHYIAYTKNMNGKWYCYNDSSCKEVEVNLLENEAPYMLFYEMDQLNSIDYMPDIKNKEPIQINQEEDEFDREVKKYCSVM